MHMLLLIRIPFKVIFAYFVVRDKTFRDETFRDGLFVAGAVHDKIFRYKMGALYTRIRVIIKYSTWP